MKSKDEKRVEFIISLSLLIVPFQVGSFIYDFRRWGFFNSINSQTYLEWISFVIGIAIFCLFVIGLVSFYRITLRNKDLEKELTKFKKESAKTIEFAELNSNPGLYRDEYVKYSGTILEKIEGDLFTHVWLDIKNQLNGFSFVNEVLIIEFNGYIRFEVDDFVTIYGKVHGIIDYESKTGNKLSLPSVSADEITLQK